MLARVRQVNADEKRLRVSDRTSFPKVIRPGTDLYTNPNSPNLLYWICVELALVYPVTRRRQHCFCIHVKLTL